MTLYVRQTPLGREVFLSPRARTASSSPGAYARLSAFTPEFLRSLMLSNHEDNSVGNAGRGVQLSVSTDTANSILGFPVRFVDLPTA